MIYGGARVTPNSYLYWREVSIGGATEDKGKQMRIKAFGLVMVEAITDIGLRKEKI